MAQPVVHFEIGCRDSERTRTFFSALFGWQIDVAGPAALIAAAPGGIGGHISALGHEPHNYVTVYVEVPDVAAYLEKAKALGGRVVVPPVEIPTGTFAWFADLDGNTIGLWKAKT